MSDLTVYRSPFNSGLSRADGRRLSREMAQLNGSAQLGIAHVEARAEIQAAKADAVAVVAQRALQDTAMLTQLEQQLAQAVPLAASRLQSIGDMAALGMADVITDTVMRLRRC